MLTLFETFWLFVSVVTVAIISACATTSDIKSSPSSVDRSADYPVTIISARFVPPIDIALSGKPDGALDGAGRGVLECAPALAAGPYAPFIFLPCAALTSIVGGTIGAGTTAPKADIDLLKSASQNSHGAAAQEMLAEQARRYLAEMSGQTFRRADTDVTGPTSTSDRPVYRLPATQAYGSLLELGILKIRYEGSGKNGAPVCLYMEARGRKIDAATGAVIDKLDYGRDILCQAAEQWLAYGGKSFETALDNGFRILAEKLIDKFYLIYYPPRYEHATDAPTRLVPDYVLAPISPRAPEMYLDFRTMTGKVEHKLGWGGMHFVDVDSMTPSLNWEAFPRTFDVPAGDFKRITYDVRIYLGSLLNPMVIEPGILLQEVTGLDEPHYSMAIPLQPCSHYFWTVRARFNLNGMRRVTEWAGAYYTAGGEVSASHDYYYPFRTPGSYANPGCWN